MGCVQGKYASTYSQSRGLDKLKQERGFAAKRGEKEDGGVAGNGEKVVDREGETVRSNDANGNFSQQNASKKIGGDDQVADGWPKWLVDNVPFEVLSGLVRKSADSYDKLAKVCTTKFMKLNI